jgi:hypothetical protein
MLHENCWSLSLRKSVVQDNNIYNMSDQLFICFVTEIKLVIFKTSRSPAKQRTLRASTLTMTLTARLGIYT